MDRLMAFASSELAGRGAVSKLNLGAVSREIVSEVLSSREVLWRSVGQSEETGHRAFRAACRSHREFRRPVGKIAPWI
jgi:hypothetical protein